LIKRRKSCFRKVQWKAGEEPEEKNVLSSHQLVEMHWKEKEGNPVLIITIIFHEKKTVTDNLSTTGEDLQKKDSRRGRRRKYQ